MTDPNELVCTALDSAGDSPGDAPALQMTDPSGQSCTALDSLGSCPGDDLSPLQQWCAGAGHNDFLAVQADLAQLQTDSDNDDLGSAMSDGSSLFQDAASAGQLLPPGTDTQKLDYGRYMATCSRRERRRVPGTSATRSPRYKRPRSSREQ